ncbi:hypothetical protein BDV35DRAFT_337131 [Aspergillus flavus]|uniref:Uncharacterized protein n=1 Tax=Aspergillus flavus TaxID=5059 RepID=A0A5N6HCG4_ASPFL|nr:hypothetical protein BDV35DRAFT_337131 [Aspergillus flavus]
MFNFLQATGIRIGGDGPWDDQVQREHRKSRQRAVQNKLEVMNKQKTIIFLFSTVLLLLPLLILSPLGSNSRSSYP